MFDVWSRPEGIKDWSTKLLVDLFLLIYIVSEIKVELHTRTREQSRIAKKIWYSIYPRKIGHDISVLPNADRADSGGGGRESGVSPSGEEYVIAEVKVYISSTPLVSAVNHMAAQTFREEKTNNKKRIVLST